MPCLFEEVIEGMEGEQEKGCPLARESIIEKMRERKEKEMKEKEGKR